MKSKSFISTLETLGFGNLIHICLNIGYASANPQMDLLKPVYSTASLGTSIET